MLKSFPSCHMMSWEQPMKEQDSQAKLALHCGLRASFKSVVQNLIAKGNGKIYRNNYRNHNRKENFKYINPL